MDEVREKINVLRFSLSIKLFFQIGVVQHSRKQDVQMPCVQREGKSVLIHICCRDF